MKKNLLKSLLLTLMVLVGGSAWADEITATLVHTASSGVPSATAGAYVSTIDAAQEYINNSAFGNKNWQGAAYAEFSFEIPAGQSIKSASMVWNGVGSGKDRTTDVLYVNAGEALDYSNTGLGSGNAEVNLPATKITTVTFPKNATTKFTTDVTDAVKTVAKTQSYVIFKFTNNAGAGNLVGKGAESGAPTLVITTADASSMTSYTVKFTDGTNELKDSAVYTNVAIGSEQTASATDMASFIVGDKKYIYASGNTTITTVAEASSNVITLVFREAATFNYSIKSSLGTTISEGTGFEGDEITYYYPQYQLSDSILYETGKNANMCRNTATLDSDNKEIVVNYNATETKGVVFLTEAEAIEGATASTAGNADIRCSMGAGAYFASDATVTTLAPGKYKLTAQVWGNATTTFVIKAGETQILAIDTKGYIYPETSQEFEIAANTSIVIPAIGNENRVLDLLYIQKTGDLTEAEIALIQAKAAFLADITAAKAIDTIGKNGAAELAAAITAAEAALAAADATTESINAAKTALAEAVAAFEDANAVIVTVDNNQYKVVGENIITNGSFDNGVDGWYSGNWNNASASNYTLQTEGGFDGGAYLQYSAGGAGVDSNIRGKWAVENGKTYLFRCYTSGKTPSSNNLQYSKFWASADGSAETTALYQLKWGANPEQVSDTWTENDFVFTASTDWVVFRSSWTTDTKLDGFMLVEVERYFSPEGYNTALAAAKTALADEEYTIVTGEERTALATTIETYANATADKYQEAIEALDAAKTTFVNAKAAYQALADVKLDIQMVGYDERFPYATTEKKTAAQATLTAEPTKAADATTMTAAIYKAYRQFAESHAMAEGVEGAVNMTDAITNPKAESAIAEPWKVVLGKGSGGSLDVKNSEPWTDGDDNATHNYFDGGNWGANAWDVSLQQNITLPAGKYLMTVKSRASEELTFTLFAGNDSTGMPALGASGNLFDRGWNNASIEFVLNSDSTLAIGVNGVAESVHQWMSFSDFRLVQLEKYETPEPVDPNDFTSYIVNADLTGEGGFDATGTKGLDGSGIVKVGNAAAFDFKQTIANLPAGKYKVTAQAAYRYGADEAAEAAAIAAETDTKLVQLYATVGEKTVSSKVQNRYDGASETDYANGNGSVTVNEKFVPNSSDAVKAWFAAGQYVNEVIFNLPADGAVTIGINRTGTPESDYTVIGPWTLTRLGDAEVEPEPEPTPEPGTDMTAKIVNPSFETGDLTGWTVGNSSDTGVKPNSNDTYKTEGCDGDYVFNTWWQGIPITQTVKGLPNGKYELKALMTNDAITAGNKACLYLLANGAHSEAFSSANAGVFAEGSMQFYVTDGTATIGAVGGNADGTFNEGGYYWYKADNFRLTYVEALPKIEDIEIPEGKMSIAAANAMTAAKEASDVVALIQAVSNAKNSIAAYAHVKDVLDFMAEEVAKTNVYTAAAKEKFDSICTATLNGYNEGTISDADAAAFNYGTRKEGLLPALLLSAFSTEADFYINTWSTEGNNDGSNFYNPFYEYWVADANTLAANTITATMSGMEAGDYDVTAWVRVRIKNGAEAPATGITMQANDGEAVNVAAGDQVGTSQMYLKEFTATGTVAEDGVLKIKFNVAAENNISWLSFKNVKFEKKPFKPEAIEGALYSWESPEGLPGEYGGKISYENGEGNRLNYQNSGYYTICLNGKKANLTDTVASANAGYMLVALDEALSEGDTINITAYVNKNESGKKASAYILFDNGANVESGVYSDESNIALVNGVPTEKSIIVTEAMAGAKSFKMTRGQTGTNLFITKFVIMKKKVATGINTLKTTFENGAIYNMNGQKVNKAHKGLYIINGRKVMIK